MKYILSCSFIIITLCIGILCFFYINLDDKVQIKDKPSFNVTILGAIKNPGDYVVNKDNLLIDLINLAGGLDVNSNVQDLDLNEQLRPKITYTIPLEIDRIIKVNLNSIIDSKVLIGIVKTYKIPISLAEVIVNQIKAFGSFKSWKEVDLIKGVGEKTLNELKKFFIIV